MKRLALPMLLLALSASAYGQQPSASAPTTWPANDTLATAEQLKAKAQRVRADLRRLSGSEKVNTELLDKRMTEVILQFDHLDLELTEKQARLEAVAIKIEKLTDQTLRAAHDDPVLKELQKIADARDAAASRFDAQNKAGVSARAESDAAVAAAAEAHVKVEERREALAAAAGGGILPALNRQLVELSLDTQVLSHLHMRLQEKRDELQAADELSLELLRISTQLAARFKQSIDEE